MDKEAPAQDVAQRIISIVGENSPLVVETSVMCDYAMTSGFDVPAHIISRLKVLLSQVSVGLNETQVDELAQIHQRLNRIVSPSTPQALVLIRMETQRSTVMRVLGAVPILRHMMFATIGFLVLFVVIGQLGAVNQDNLQHGILYLQGLDAVFVLLYLISCAGLGASFTALYRLNKYVSQATYDPRFDSTYWSALLLGLIAGVFISELLYETLFGAVEALNGSVAGAAGAGATPGVGEAAAAADVATAGDTADVAVPSEDAAAAGGLSVANMGKPALALLGGFSANMVYKVLQRIVDTIESLFKGDQKLVLEAKRAADVSQLRTLHDEARMQLASQLSELEKQWDKDPTAAREALRAKVGEMLTRG